MKRLTTDQMQRLMGKGTPGVDPVPEPQPTSFVRYPSGYGRN